MITNDVIVRGIVLLVGGIVLASFFLRYVHFPKNKKSAGPTEPLFNWEYEIFSFPEKSTEPLDLSVKVKLIIFSSRRTGRKFVVAYHEKSITIERLDD